MINLSTLSRPPFSPIEKTILDFFKFFPDLPKSWIRFLARLTPIVTLIGAVLSLFSLFFHPFSFNLFRFLAQLIGGVLLFAAYKPLKNSRSLGITYLFWSSISHNLLNFAWYFSPFVILNAAIGFYFLYQLRPHFPKK